MTEARQKAEDVYYSALDLMAEGQLEKAADAYRESLNIDPTFTEAMHGLARALQDLQRFDEAIEVAKKLTGNPEFYNLPRKFKISVTGCPIWCSYPEINDVALTALKRKRDNGEEEVGYSIRVGGGLSNQPHIAVRLPIFVPQEKAFDAVRAVCETFRDSEALRESRTSARIKYLFMKFGWTAETMLAAIEEREAHAVAAPFGGTAAHLLAAWRLDLDDLRAGFGQQQRRQRSR